MEESGEESEPLLWDPENKVTSQENQKDSEIKTDYDKHLNCINIAKSQYDDISNECINTSDRTGCASDSVNGIDCTCNQNLLVTEGKTSSNLKQSDQSNQETNVHISCLCDSLNDSQNHHTYGRSLSSPQLYEESDLRESGKEYCDDEKNIGSSGSSSEASVSFSLWSTTRREKLILISMASIELSSFMCLSIMAPFFPDEAAKNGISDTISGWIFGIFALAQFVCSPIFGKVMPLLGARFMFLAGQFFAGGCVILFGLLDFVSSAGSNRIVYLIMAFSLRIFLAIGCTASTTASFAITANTFPDNVATVFGLLETATGLGMMLGPALGGVLYELGGFVLPFVALGAFMILTVPVNILILPRQEDEGVQSPQTGSLLQFMKVPAIWIVCLAVIMAATIWSILDPTLEPHLSVFNLSPSVVGLVFLLMSAFYAVFSPIWGWVADHVPDSSPMLVGGFVLSGVGLLLLGPSPIFGLDSQYNELWLNIVALVILGISSSLALVPTFEKILDSAEKAGIEDNFAMYGVVAGLWGGCYALGDFIGPTVGGWGMDKFGFPWCMTYVAAGCFLMALVIFGLWIWEIKFGPSGAKQVELVHPSTERTPLLASERSAPNVAIVRSLSTQGNRTNSPLGTYRPLGIRHQVQVPKPCDKRRRLHRTSSGDFESTSVRSYCSTMTV